MKLALKFQSSIGAKLFEKGENGEFFLENFKKVRKLKNESGEALLPFEFPER